MIHTNFPIGTSSTDTLLMELIDRHEQIVREGAKLDDAVTSVELSLEPLKPAAEEAALRKVISEAKIVALLLRAEPRGEKRITLVSDREDVDAVVERDPAVIEAKQALERRKAEYEEARLRSRLQELEEESERLWDAAYDIEQGIRNFPVVTLTGLRTKLRFIRGEGPALPDIDSREFMSDLVLADLARISGQEAQRKGDTPSTACPGKRTLQEQFCHPAA